MGRARKTTSFTITDELLDEIQSAARREQVSQTTIITRALTQFFSTKVARSSWDTEEESGWYDEKKFYVYSQDKKGHSHYARIWIPKNLAGLIGRVVNSEQIPEYRSSQDFYRDALFHRAHKIAEWIDNEELKGEVGVLTLKAEEEAINRMKKDAEELIEVVEQNLREAWDNGEYEWLESHIATRMDRASVIPETHRGQYMGVLRDYAEKLKEVKRGRVGNLSRKRREIPEAAN